MENIQDYIHKYASLGAELRLRFFKDNSAKISGAAKNMAIALAKGKKLLLCGNGGSAADAQHIAGEFVNKFLMDRPGLPAIALTTDTSVLTAIGNDLDYTRIFSRQIEALANPGDVLLAISTSGKSPNILAAIATAREKNMFVIGLTGENTPMSGLCDIALQAAGKSTPHIQEQHLACEHVLCSLTDHFLFENVAAIAPFLQSNEEEQNAHI